MPIASIKRKIKNNLDKLGYKPQDSGYKPSKNLKRSILDNNDIEIEVLQENQFNIYMRSCDFHEILANNFYYNYRRFRIQSEQLELICVSESVAWFLISMYYGAFFASNEIANLAGYFSFNFSNEEKNALLKKNISTNQEASLSFIKSNNQNFFGEMSFLDKENTIKISCKSGGGKPHELSWITLSKLLLRTSHPDATARTIRLKNILKNESYWKRPNQIRNEWNYSKAELYSVHNNQYIHDKNKYFNNFTELKHWAENRNKSPKGENDDFISIMFLFNTLSLVMKDIKDDIL